MIAIIDYGIGNIGSVLNAFKYLGFDAFLTRDKEEILKSDKIVLPGVGAFKDAIETLKAYKLDEVIYEAIKKNIPILGICVGMQLLCEASTEFGYNKGLGVFKGTLEKFPLEICKRVPEIGFNQLEIANDCKITQGISNNNVYFVHSYYLTNEDASEVGCYTDYNGIRYPSLLHKDNIYACQFHPEKSGEVGLKILRNFGEL